MAHLPPVLARRQNHDSTRIGKMRAAYRAEGGQVESVLGGKANLDYVKPHSFAFELLA
jgi:hypothetical protein